MQDQTRRNLLLALVFLAGCAASRVQWIPPADAQAGAGTPRWDYHCMQPQWGPGESAIAATTAQLKLLGQQGWELVTVDARAYCLKRPLR
ncbi:hypothetical protein [Pyxidicoccus sp. MSG2]|uniref:hypothetical protein n=1 Tax=Pyxidicoccus sp. MSG2 TaxID=2996790 RepID=UPI00226E1E5F|nr:hypothetical protein [Pyxidicoccus sp. MSG2]MCY1017593.1 hypothetical protein [Pyxidicoccus sp. MSG2]